MSKKKTKENYIIKKGIDTHVDKSYQQKFLTVKQLRQILACIEKMHKPRWERDYCGIYLGFYLGLRCSEAVLLNRDSFRHLESGQILLRTKKQLPRVGMHCSCGRRWRASVKSIGKQQLCPKCSDPVVVPEPKKKYSLDPPEKSLPSVETAVVQYIQKYMKHSMRANQHWFLEGGPGRRMSVPYLRKLFNFYLVKAGLPPEYSYHALRHGRGVQIWERFQDHAMVRDFLRQKSLGAAEFYIRISPARQDAFRKQLDKAYEEEHD